MHKPNQPSLHLSAVTTALALLASPPALGQQQPPVSYTPPPVILITPPTDQNPYLIYTPLPQAAPTQVPMPQPVQAAPIAPSTAAAADAEKPPAGPTLSDLGKSLRSYFTEDELDLLFEYMKESVLASFKGEEVSLPPDIAFKLEILLVRLQKQSGQYMDNLIKQLERDLKRSLKEKLTPPGAQPPPPLPQTTPASGPGVQPAPPSQPSALPPAGSSKRPVKKTAKNV